MSDTVIHKYVQMLYVTTIKMKTYQLCIASAKMLRKRKENEEIQQATTVIGIRMSNNNMTDTPTKIT